MNTKSRIFLALLALALAPLAGHAQIIYYHTFDAGTGTLNGTSPDTAGSLAPDGAVWHSATTITANGTDGNTSAGSSAWLSIAGVWTANTDYRLTLDYTTSKSWIALGFSSAATPTLGNMGTTTTGSAGWMMIRGTGDTYGDARAVNVYGGPGTGTPWLGASDNKFVSALGNMQMIIDVSIGSSLADTTLSYSVVGSDGATTLVLTKTGVNVSTWQWLGVSFSNKSTGGTLNSLTFEVVPVPEPSVFAALVGAATLGVVLFRRRRRHA